ncbi:MAG: hypothetical protein J6K58_01615 [Lachnospiraceae bacterium]|nr:hypothetical protein [Lachnospiraceae bacterium]
MEKFGKKNKKLLQNEKSTVIIKSEIEQVFEKRTVNMEDKKVLEAIKKIVLSNGNNAEVRKKPDGSLVVYEVKKHIVTS